MTKRRTLIPLTLLLWGVGLLVLGLIAGPVIRAAATPEQLANNVLLNAIPFILIFAAIILAFITLIVVVSRLLSHAISAGAYRAVEAALIAGIVLGVVGMFQPWLFILYKLGFLVLLLSTLGFIVWSHVLPRSAPRASTTDTH